MWIITLTLRHTLKSLRPVVVVLVILSAAHAQTASEMLQRARSAVGWSRVAGVLHYHSAYAWQQNYQSERMYPPYFDAIGSTDNWFSPQTGILRASSKMTYPAGGAPASLAYYDSERGITLRGDRATPVPLQSARIRDLDAWAVLYDWSQAKDVRVADREVYRDFPRVVLARATPRGEEHLFLDPKSGFPVKLEYTEPHYLWGQRHVEYLYSLWQLQSGVVVSTASFRLADGEVEISSTMDELKLVAATDADIPSLAMPAVSAPAPEVAPFLQPLPPESIQVGPSTYLLTNFGYTEAVTLAADEIYVFDATQGEARARQDQTIIRKLFPGARKVNVILTDLAWPHIAGLRFWVAQGATIYSHASSRAFLQKVIDRRWTLHPDTLEQQRASANFRFVPITSAQQLAGGKVRLAPIDGIGSEGALMAFVPAESFLWASDYLQDNTQPTEYASEIFGAVQRVGWAPQRVAAEHLELTAWETITKLVFSSPGSPRNGR